MFGGVCLSGLKDKLSGLKSLIVKDKFENELKNALKRHNFSVADKLSNTLYEIASGTSKFQIDVSSIKQEYDNAISDEAAEIIITRLEKEFVTESKMISFTNGQSLLRFLVMREEEISNDCLFTDFVSGLKKVIVYSSDDITLHILSETYLKKWSVPREVVFSVADRNMCKLLEKAQINESNLSESVKAIEFSLPNKELSVSMMMCNEFRKTVYKKLGAKFLVVAPSRESLLILENVTNNILEGLGTVIISEYRKSKFPLTTDVLLFTPYSIEIAGRFSVGDVKHEVDSEKQLV